jgi:hypothetical protein
MVVLRKFDSIGNAFQLFYDRTPAFLTLRAEIPRSLRWATVPSKVRSRLFIASPHSVAASHHRNSALHLPVRPTAQEAGTNKKGPPGFDVK